MIAVVHCHLGLSLVAPSATLGSETYGLTGREPGEQKGSAIVNFGFVSLGKICHSDLIFKNLSIDSLMTRRGK